MSWPAPHPIVRNNGHLWSSLAETVAQLDFTPTPEDPTEGDRIRETRLGGLPAQGEDGVRKPDAQDKGNRFPGRRLTGQDAVLQFHTAAVEAGLSQIVRLDRNAKLFADDADVHAKARAELFDGKFVVVTYVKDFTAHDLINRYRYPLYSLPSHESCHCLCQLNPFSNGVRNLS